MWRWGRWVGVGGMVCVCVGGWVGVGVGVGVGGGGALSGIGWRLE
jgi:hypothetical protein